MALRAHLFARTARLLAAASVAGCGSVDLEPIHAPPPQDGGAPRPGSIDAGADADSATVSCKRGMAATGGPTAALAPSATSPGITWWYNWTTQSPGGDPRVEYVPMVWGGGSLNQAIPAKARYLLGFNEPNFKSQANLTAQQAALDWPAVEARARPLGIPIGSPGVNFCGSSTDASKCTEPTVTDPYTYLKEFFADCTGCEVDFIAVHAYVCDVASLRDYLEGDVASGGTLEGFLQFGKPLWITEIACDATHSVGDQKAYMQVAIPYLEANGDVVRYAWFNATPVPNGMLTNADGLLTDLGATYVALPESCR